MDFANLFKQFSKSEKIMLSCFIVLLPLCFTMLYMYIPEFKSLDMYIQFIFSSAMSVGCIYLSTIAHFIPAVIISNEYKANKIILLLPTIGVSFFTIPNYNNYDMGYRFILYSIIIMNIIFAIIAAITEHHKRSKGNKYPSN